MTPATIRLVLGGLKSFVLAPETVVRGNVARASGAYSYSVWMRHLALITKAVKRFRPTSVVELGPGGSLGLGCAALLSGADHYVGLDVVDHIDAEHDVAALDELVTLFERRASIPADDRFPALHPRLPSYAFPRKMFADDGPRVIRTDHERVQSIRAALVNRQTLLYDDVPIGFQVGWDSRAVDPCSVDLVITQNVLQEIAHDAPHSKLTDTFVAMAKWLKRGGVMSHQIDLSFPGGAEWNDHWRHSDAAWRVARGIRSAFANRVPLSEYLELCRANGFDVVSVKRETKDGIAREKAAPKFRDLPEDDFHTPSAHVVAVKR